MAEQELATLTGNFRQRRKDMVFFCTLAMVGCFLLWKCRIGIGNFDETFYLTIPYRLLRGDALFQEEWHLSQMSGVLLVPAVWLYTRLTGGTEGILLAMRFVCVAVMLAASAFLYLRLKRFDWLGASAAALSFALYIPFSINALSYNSMGILFLTLSQVTLLTAAGKPLQSLLAGLCFAAAVLCCPYLLIVYLLWLLIAGAAFASGRGREQTAFSPKTVLWFSLGAAAAAAAFLTFVFSRTTPANLLRCIGPMLDDPEHPAVSLWGKVAEYVKAILYATDTSFRYYEALFLAGVVCVLGSRFRRFRGILSCCAGAAVLALMLCLYREKYYLNHLMWAVNCMAPFLLLLSDNPKLRDVFLLLWGPGMLYSFCMNLSSNQAFYVISSGATVATVGTLTMLGMYLRELLTEEPKAWGSRAAAVLLGALLLTQLSTELDCRYHNVFWEDGIYNQTVRLERGINKGLLVSENRAAYFNWCLEIQEAIDSYGGEQVLYLSEITWFCLQGQGNNAGYSAWLSGVDDHTLDRLEAYYAINPRKIPDVVFVEHRFEQIAEPFCSRFGYTQTPVVGGFVLLPETP